MQIDVLIITTLKEEYDAVRAVENGVVEPWQSLKDASGFPYDVGRFSTGDNGSIRMALARTVNMGGFAATATASRLAKALRPRVLASCGICAGRRGKVFLGDVIVADKVFQFDDGMIAKQDRQVTTYNLDPRWKFAMETFQKDWHPPLLSERPLSLESQESWVLANLYSKEDGGPSIARHPRRPGSAPDWTRVIRSLREKELITARGLALTKAGRDYIEELLLLHPDGLPDDPPFAVHIGPIATVSRVVEDDRIFQRLGQLDRKVIGLDMEAAELGMVAGLERVPRMFIAKGVCDYADFQKDDRFRRFAARASAELTIAFLCRNLEPGTPSLAEEPVASSAPAVPFTIKRLQLRNFKCFRNLDLHFGGDSILPGTWNCIAGLNGAGKSSVLQALCLLLLGDRKASGIEGSLAGMRRDENGTKRDAELVATLSREGNGERNVVLYINEQGIDHTCLQREDDYAYMVWAWEDLDKQIILSYGPSRNISEYRDGRFDHLNKQVRNQMTLFDPLSRLEDIDVLLGEYDADSPVLALLQALLDTLLADFDIQTRVGKDRAIFEMAGALVPATDLPDGFRSLVSWLANLCVAWNERYPEQARSKDPKEIKGIVLLDEIDLHLHASLQRLIVPKLRESLPGIQWIVTTHSPLVLSSFDRNELILLDHEEADGARKLDRQILGFSMDQVSDWLMGANPRSVFIEEQLKLANQRPKRSRNRKRILATSWPFVARRPT